MRSTRKGDGTAGARGGTVKPVGEPFERERPVGGCVGGFCTRGLDVEEDVLCLLKGMTGLPGTGYHGVGVGCCLRAVRAVANTFRLVFAGYPKGLAVANELSHSFSSFFLL